MYHMLRFYNKMFHISSVLAHFPNYLYYSDLSLAHKYIFRLNWECDGMYHMLRFYNKMPHISSVLAHSPQRISDCEKWNDPVNRFWGSMQCCLPLIFLLYTYIPTDYSSKWDTETICFHGRTLSWRSWSCRPVTNVLFL